MGISLGAAAEGEKVELIGLNVAGAAFASSYIPGQHGTNYFFPGDDYFDKWRDKGVRRIRFSILWERLQPEMKGELDEDYARRIDTMLAEAEAHNIKVLLDVHNYGRYYGKTVGTEEAPLAIYRDLMERIARRWGENPAVYAYDIMNEPYGSANAYWPALAQVGIDGIRTYDQRKAIYVEGRNWSSAQNWPGYNDSLLALEDPADNIVFSAHIYIDPNSSGSYTEALSEDPDPMIGVNRVKPFVNWLIKHGKRGHIGEFGVPGDDPRWLVPMDNLLAYLQQQCIPFDYWAAGPSWGGYKLSVEPIKGEDRPQWPVLAKYLGGGSCTAIGPGT
jgi:endoglucanase